MSDTGKKKTLSLGNGEPLSLRKPGESVGSPARGGMGGGRKTVQVEVRRRRALARANQAAGDVAGVSRNVAPNQTVGREPVVDSKLALRSSADLLGTVEVASGRARHVLKTLSTEEKSARAKALDNAQAADQAARARAEENARRQVKEATRLASEREAADARRSEEEERKKTEEEARRRAEEEAARKLTEKEAKVAVEAAAQGDLGGKRSTSGSSVAGQRRTERRTDEKPKQQLRTRLEPRRRAGRITVTEALADREDRVRSLTSIRRERERRKKLAAENAENQTKIVREVVVPEMITVQELANRMAERGVDVVRSLMGLGVMVTVNQSIDADTAELVVAEFGHKLRRVAEADVEIGLKGAIDSEGDLQSRAPVVTVMGHVDHGKTSLLDAIRESDVVEGEAGGITQHIGAYQVTTPTGSKITFIDTPGHAAFTAMRARGTRVTDLVVLVVAADDGVMPQTIEAINHAKAANVPLIVAINKMDLPDANPDKVKQELLQYEVIPEEMGGDVQVVEVSAIQKHNLDGLEEVILLQAELLELQSNPERLADGVVVEAKLDRGRGAVATVLVQRGTLRIGDIFVAGSQSGKVRALLDTHGNNVDEAMPSMPVEVLGLNGAPDAGDEFNVVETEAR
ncbi:MAG: translation initiation factor IF-2, partial [Alphaproteobacteria bacterium]